MKLRRSSTITTKVERSRKPAIGETLDFLELYLELSETSLEEARRSRLPQFEHPDFPDVVKKVARASLDTIFNDLKQTMRYSSAVMLHVTFETRLKEISSQLQIKHDVPLKMNELSGGKNGSMVGRFKNYLRLCRIEIKSIPEWEQLRNFETVRNCIIHADGQIADSRDDKEFEKICRDTHGLSINADGRLMLGESFCLDHLSILRNFFDRFSPKKTT